MKELLLFILAIVFFSISSQAQTKNISTLEEEILNLELEIQEIDLKNKDDYRLKRLHIQLEGKKEELNRELEKNSRLNTPFICEIVFDIYLKKIPKDYIGPQRINFLNENLVGQVIQTYGKTTAFPDYCKLEPYENHNNLLVKVNKYEFLKPLDYEKWAKYTPLAIEGTIQKITQEYGRYIIQIRDAYILKSTKDAPIGEKIDFLIMQHEEEKRMHNEEEKTDKRRKEMEELESMEKYKLIKEIELFVHEIDQKSSLNNKVYPIEMYEEFHNNFEDATSSHYTTPSLKYNLEVSLLKYFLLTGNIERAELYYKFAHSTNYFNREKINEYVKDDREIELTNFYILIDILKNNDNLKHTKNTFKVNPVYANDGKTINDCYAFRDLLKELREIVSHNKYSKSKINNCMKFEKYLLQKWPRGCEKL